MGTSSSKERLEAALSYMEDHLKTIQLIRTTETADELLTALVTAKLKGFTPTESQQRVIEDEILKRRRDAISQDEIMARLAIDSFPAPSE